MPELTAVRIPLENVNDETVRLIAWNVKEGQAVHEGQGLAEVETSKAVFEITAPVSGVVRLVAREGDDVPVGATICHIGPESALPGATTAAEARGRGGDLGAGPGALDAEGARFSQKAAELVARHGLSPALFAGRGLVRERDVLEQLERGSPAAADPSSAIPALRGVPLTGVTLPAGLAASEEGRLDAAFLSRLREDPSAFGRLGSAEKCAAYREHGAVIGKDVHLGAGTVIVAPCIVLGDEVRIEERGDIACRERFVAGALTSFRSDLSVRGGTVVLGQGVYGGSRIVIGGGGHADPWALLCVGDTAFLGDDLYLNICRPIVIGRETFVTQRSILVTHNIGHSPLDGYENRFAPIVLEDLAQVGMSCTLYAGSRLGLGAIVTSNSYLISSIPAGKLAMGVPAKVVRDAARPPDRARQLQIVEGMIRDFHELLRMKGREVSPLPAGAPTAFQVSHEGQRFVLSFHEELSAGALPGGGEDERVIWTFDAAGGSVPAGCTIMDVLHKRLTGQGGLFAETAREFLRKRGIRLQPGPWRYRRGLI